MGHRALLIVKPCCILMNRLGECVCILKLFSSYLLAGPYIENSGPPEKIYMWAPTAFQLTEGHFVSSFTSYHFDFNFNSSRCFLEYHWLRYNVVLILHYNIPMIYYSILIVTNTEDYATNFVLAGRCKDLWL